MKKQFLLFAAATLFSVSSLMAQAARQMPTPEERTKTTMEKINAFNLTADNSAKVQTILTDFYKSQQELKALIQKMYEADKDELVKRKHPFFGKMKLDEWGGLNYKHFDHHLRQFGV